MRLHRISPYSLIDLSGIISNQERILVLGASGWFGQTFLNMIDKSVPTLVIGSSKKDKCQVWDPNTIKDFQPTLVANFAFLPRHKLSNYSRDDYISINMELIERMRFASQLEKVKAVVSISSGASQNVKAQDGINSQDIYGALKKYEESVVLSCQTSNRSTVILRTYSVSGPFVRDIDHYAFSSFVQQSLVRKEIQLLSNGLVFRRYVSVGDLLAIGFARAVQGWSGLIESGGQLIELSELSRLIAGLLGARVKDCIKFESSQIDSYFSDNRLWEDHIRELKFQPLGLEEQIEVTAEYIKRVLKP
jgi:nucleoside-diphosphate-sugar epimerase